MKEKMGRDEISVWKESPAHFGVFSAPNAPDLTSWLVSSLF